MLVYWRPSVTVPKRSLLNPTKAWRPNGVLPWPNCPLLTLMPDSNVKIVFSPPPRSSEPRRPQRLPLVPETESTNNCLPPTLTPLTVTLLLVLSITPSSTSPYSVTLVCACAAPANGDNTANARSLFFIESSPNASYG